MASCPSQVDTDDIENDIVSLIAATDLKSFKALQQKRKGRRISATKALNNLDSKLTDLQSAQAVIDKLKDLHAELKALDLNIHDLLFASSKYEEATYLTDLEACELYQENLLIGIKKAEITVSSLNAANAANQLKTNPGGQTSPNKHVPGFNPSMSLPKIEMPMFSGNPLHYSRFISELDSILDRTPYSEFQKFKLLEQSLKGQAKALVSIPGMHAMTYSSARTVLDKAYKDSEMQKFAIVESLSNLKFNDKEPFYWLSEANKLKEQVAFLNMTTDSFVLYFLWNSLPRHFKDQYVALTQKTQPSVHDVLDKFFDVNHRTKGKDFSPESAPQQTVTMTTTGQPVSDSKNGTNASSKKPACPYCSSLDHSHGKCPKFTNPSSRIQRLKTLNRCTKCTLPHATENCNFRFKYKCSKCKSNYFAGLCVKTKNETSHANAASTSQSSDDTGTKTGDASNPPQVFSGVTVAYTNSGSTNNSTQVILPSFTTTIESPSGVQRDIRVWKDSCSQSTLIEESLANEMSLETEDNLTLTLKGINGAQTFKTRKVKVPIKINGLLYTIFASVVPKIDISLNVPGIDRVVGEFCGRGFTVADKYLRGPRITDGQMLLGSDNSYLLPLSTVVFGDSSYLQSPLGVMFEGNIDNVINNLPSLVNPPTEVKRN